MVCSCPLGALALGFPGGAGQGLSPPVFCWGHSAWGIKQPEMAATCARLGDSQAKPSCESRLTVASAGTEST